MAIARMLIEVLHRDHVTAAGLVDRYHRIAARPSLEIASDEPRGSVERSTRGRTDDDFYPPRRLPFTRRRETGRCDAKPEARYSNPQDLS